VGVDVYYTPPVRLAACFTWGLTVVDGVEVDIYQAWRIIRFFPN
jgi:hypothetical protein